MKHIFLAIVLMFCMVSVTNADGKGRGGHHHDSRPKFNINIGPRRPYYPYGYYPAPVYPVYPYPYYPAPYYVAPQPPVIIAPPPGPSIEYRNKNFGIKIR